MLAENPMLAVHAGEEQSSIQPGAQPVHWTFAAVRLLQAARAIANGYLREERDDVLACVDADHHIAVRALFDAIKSADSTGVALACAELNAKSGANDIPAAIGAAA